MSFRECLSQLVAQHPKKVFALVALAVVAPEAAGIFLIVLSQSLPSGELFGNCNPAVFDKLRHVAPGQIFSTIRENCHPFGYCGESITHVSKEFSDALCAQKCDQAYLFSSEVFRLCSSNPTGGAGGFLLLAGGFPLLGAFAYAAHHGIVSRAIDSVKNSAQGAVAWVGSFFHSNPVAQSSETVDSLESGDYFSQPLVSPINREVSAVYGTEMSSIWEGRI